MGFGAADKNGITISPDPVLKWAVPSKWTLEESVSISKNYGLVS